MRVTVTVLPFVASSPTVLALVIATAIRGGRGKPAAEGSYELGQQALGQGAQDDDAAMPMGIPTTVRLLHVLHRSRFLSPTSPNSCRCLR